jgi:hypothetical protein
MNPVPTATALAILAALTAMPAAAGEADVVAATATRHGAVWRFDVTVAHADSGWDHYADRWDVLTPDGTLLGSRTLLHPHVDEQPFTRSLDNVTIPPGVTAVVIRAHDKAHGLGGREFRLDLPSGGGS